MARHGFLAAIVLLLLAVGGPSVADQTLRAGVASMITPVSAVKYYQQVVDYLGQKLGMPAEMVHRTTYDEIDVMLEEGKLDVAFICSSPYVLDKKKFGVELLVAPQVNGAAYYRSNIIVHKDSRVETFEQLRGKPFVFVDPKSNSGRLYPVYLLAKRQETPESFFSSFLYSYSHNKSVEIVAKNRAEGAAVDSIVYDFMVATESPYAAQTKIIQRSPQFGIPPVVVPPGIAPRLKLALREIFLNMHADPLGKTILEGMRIERFIEVPDSNYDPIRAMSTFIENNKIALEAGDGQAAGSLRGDDGTIYFGVLPRDNPVTAYGQYQPLVDYLARSTGQKIELRLEKSYQDVVGSLGEGRIFFALLGPLTYLDAYKRFAAPPIARARTARGETFFRTVIVADANGGIQEISQLVDKKFAFGALWSTSGNLIPRYMLAWAGIHLENLKEYRNYGYNDTVAKKIISKEFDAGAISLSTAERYLPYGLKIIATSDPIPTGPVVVSPKAPYALVKKVQQALLSLSDHEEGRKVLSKLDADLQGGFVAASDADYAGIRRMINDVPLTCGKACHPKVSF
ncbi:MAG: phosphate/phosphite/phosphonate ABC transporter substrate-binding protein [Proteobacteria bacterium]|nr:phosphate/phosphite/phosphonate ABC transporter substrate-binding protein [Pseudomonadota bacterium]